MPGTLGLGEITLGGDFNNVLPGNVDNRGGIHFITQFPLTINGGGTVTTNANSWINFGTDLLTQSHAAGPVGVGQFFGGAKGSGSVVNYGPLDPSMFHTNAPDATR